MSYKDTITEYNEQQKDIKGLKSGVLPPFFSLRCLSWGDLRVLGYLSFCDARFSGDVYVSQGRIARCFGYSREQVNRIIGRLVSHGYITKVYRYALTCIYSVASWVRQMLAPCHKALNYLRSIVAPGASRYQNVTLDNSRCYIYNSLSNYIVSLTRARAGKNKNMKKVEVPPSVLGVTKLLNLTKWGQIKLSGFPDGAIFHASLMFKTNQPNSGGSTPYIRDPFSWFFKACLSFCSEKHLLPDWQLVDALKSLYNMPDDARMTTMLPLVQSTPVIPAPQPTCTKGNAYSCYSKFDRNSLAEDPWKQERERRRAQYTEEDNLKAARFMNMIAT